MGGRTKEEAGQPVDLDRFDFLTNRGPQKTRDLARAVKIGPKPLRLGRATLRLDKPHPLDDSAKSKVVAHGDHLASFGRVASYQERTLAQVRRVTSQDRDMEIRHLGKSDGPRARATRGQGAGSSSNRASLSSSITNRFVAKSESRDSTQRPTRSA